MRTAPLSFLVFSMAGCLAWGQAVDTTDDVRKGRHLAILLCAGCHVVAPEQPHAPTLEPPAPSFAAIAMRSGTTFDSLRHFLITTHQGIDNPKGMPNPDLADFQIKQIGAYLLSLRK
jgi:mono/diheme cytochrome c family protein